MAGIGNESWSCFQPKHSLILTLGFHKARLPNAFLACVFKKPVKYEHKMCFSNLWRIVVEKLHCVLHTMLKLNAVPESKPTLSKIQDTDYSIQFTMRISWNCYAKMLSSTIAFRWNFVQVKCVNCFEQFVYVKEFGIWFEIDEHLFASVCICLKF